MDVYRLEYELKSRNITIDKYCEMLGINRSTYYRKRRGETEFTVKEIRKTCEILKIESPMDIFFADMVS